MKNRRKVRCTVEGCEWAGFSFNLAKHQRSHFKRRIRDLVNGLISWVAVEPILPANPWNVRMDATEDEPEEATVEAPGDTQNPGDATGDER